MRKINKGLAALAVTAGLMALTACGSQSLSEAQPPEAVPSVETYVEHEPPTDEEVRESTEGTEGDTTGSYSDDKLAVAGKQAVTYNDGLVVDIGNIKRAKVPEYNDHPGEPMVRFDVKITNGTSYKMDAVGASVSLSYGADGRNATSVYVEDDALGFTGAIAKGRSKTAGFSFEVPAKYMGDMLIEVSPDYEHDAALFEASVK